MKKFTIPFLILFSALAFGAYKGIGTAGKISTAVAGGTPSWAWENPYRSVTTTDAAALSDKVLVLSGASFTETLPTAASNSGKTFILVHNGTSLTQVYTLATTSAQTIGGIASGSYALYTAGERLVLVSDGSNWQIVEHETRTPWTSGGTNSVNATGGGTTLATTKQIDTVKWYREGNIATIEYNCAYSSATGAVAGSGDYLWALPANMTMDSSLVSFVTTTSANLTDYTLATSKVPTDGVYWSGNTHRWFLTGLAYDSSHIRFGAYDVSTPAYSMWSSSFLGVVTGTSSWKFVIKIPITNWQP